jgi:dipeptidase E
MKANRVIFAIGGGDIGIGETLPIDKKIVEAVYGNRYQRHGSIKALFIPTASGDDLEYFKAFNRIYKSKLGCDTDVLLLYNDIAVKVRPCSRASIKRQIDRCDLVYVGGGSTPAMLRMWRKHNIDKYLHQAWNRGAIMSGLSAGANCWFKYGLSDAYSGRWATVVGLGFINYACNVHYSSQRGRKKHFDKLVRHKNTTGIALDDNACIMIINDNYKIIKADRNAGVYRLTPEQGRVHRLEMSLSGQLHNK